MENPGIRLLVADSHRLYAEALCQTLARHFTVRAVFDVQTLLLVAPAVDVAILCGDFAGSTGLETVRRLRAVRPGIRTVVIGDRWTRSILRRCWEAGARGFLTRESSVEELVDAAHAVSAGKRYTARPPQSTGVGETPEARALTTRQSEVLQLVSEGLSAKEIAQRIHVSQRTVEFHKANIMRLLGLRSSPQLIRFAMEWPSGEPKEKKH